MRSVVWEKNSKFFICFTKKKLLPALFSESNFLTQCSRQDCKFDTCQFGRPQRDPWNWSICAASLSLKTILEPPLKRRLWLLSNGSLRIVFFWQSLVALCAAQVEPFSGVSQRTPKPTMMTFHEISSTLLLGKKLLLYGDKGKEWTVWKPRWWMWWTCNYFKFDLVGDGTKIHEDILKIVLELLFWNGFKPVF